MTSSVHTSYYMKLELHRVFSLYHLLGSGYLCPQNTSRTKTALILLTPSKLPTSFRWGVGVETECAGDSAVLENANDLLNVKHIQTDQALICLRLKCVKM